MKCDIYIISLVDFWSFSCLKKYKNQRDVTMLYMLLCSDLFVSNLFQNLSDWLNILDL